MVDPKFWTDDKIIELKRETRLLFIGMWNFSNDYGLHINNNKVLKAEIYPVDEDINIKAIEFMKEELIKMNLIELGSCENTKTLLIKIKNWELYQKISKPQPSKYNYIPGTVLEHSETNIGTFPPNKIEYNKIKNNKIKDIVQKPKQTSGLKPYKDRVKEYFESIDDEFKKELKEAYPNVNINQELINSKMWLLTNTHKAKKYFKRFVNSWMSRQMERGGRPSYLTTKDEVLAEKTEQLIQKEKKERLERQKEAEKNAASSEEIQSTMNDTLKELKKRKIERLKNVTNIQDQESKNPN